MNPADGSVRCRPGVAMDGGIEVYLETLRSAERGGVGEDVLRALRRAEASRRGLDDAGLDTLVRDHIIARRASLDVLERLHGVARAADAAPTGAPMTHQATEPPDPPAFLPVARWPVLMPRYRAPCGLVMDFVGSCEALVADGRRFGSALSDPVMAMRLAREAARSVVQVYRLLDGDEVLGCGELLVRNGFLVPVRTVTRSDWRPGCERAAWDLVEAVTRGAIRTDLMPRGDRFVPAWTP